MSLNGATKWLGLTLTALIGMGSLLVWVGSISADAADTKRRVTTVETRQSEDRADTKDAIKKFDAKVEKVDEKVDRILDELRKMQRSR